MNIFEVHSQVVDNYKSYLTSFLSIKDEDIRKVAEEKFEQGGFIPEPLIQFNPSYAKGESLENLVAQGKIHEDLPGIFGSYQLYKHQVEALKFGIENKGFIVTSGTGSGKSLTYLATIFNCILKSRNKEKGLKAILVYPMNALINSQEEEIRKYELNYLKNFLSPEQKKEVNEESTLEKKVEKARTLSSKKFPITYSKYTGQEGSEAREKVKKEKPDIILTNYMMLELIMTRQAEDWMRESVKDHLQHLVFDELHTYRGRQGSDVSLLVRRIQHVANKDLVCIGTSATMATEGTREERQQAVANVGFTIFGKSFDKEQIIGEYLDCCTNYKMVLPPKEEVKSSCLKGVSTDGSAEEFVNHPLAIWLENSIALNRANKENIERGMPVTLTAISEKLADYINAPLDEAKGCIQQLLLWAEKLNIASSQQGLRKSYLPFKIHQFISQTSTVYVTLDKKGERTILIDAGRYGEGENKDRFIYPVLFSRISGAAFICVTKDFENKTLKPRDLEEPINRLTQSDARRLNLTEEHFPQGYIILPDEGEEELWTQDDNENLPESWFRGNTQGLDPFYELQTPHKIYFDKNGKFSSEPVDESWNWGWFISAKLRIDPTAGVIYDDIKVSENTKLMRLGNEGRSTATTIMAYSVIQSLHHQKESTKNQKLLSFTDNRQDASLQTGHFNDFLSTVKLRSALYHSLKENKKGLRIYDIAGRVSEKLHLKESDYAQMPNDKWPDPENQRALQDFILIRLIYDLKRGWRYVLPNLEQSGLLDIKYFRLDEFTQVEDFFKGLELFEDFSPKEREEVITQVLNYFRTSYAIHHIKLEDQRAETENFLKSKLDSKKPWALNQNERIDIPYYLVASNPGRTNRYIFTASIGYRSSLGKYFKRLFTEKKGPNSLDKDHYNSFIEKLCDLLVSGNLLAKREDIRGDRGSVAGYQLRGDSIIWSTGNEKTVPLDNVRLASYKDLNISPNKFFQQLYKYDFTTYDKPLVGREHTGQLDSSDRVEREDAFREGQISALFCSPTMELGIDISDLNIVHMRNVPPNPANYAQRSGRAGRSGQTALAITYCSMWSPHDRSYFKSAERMVAGSVVPPRIDLHNEELIRSHLHAFILKELGISDLSVSVSEMINLVDADNLPLKENVQSYIEDQASHNSKKWKAGFREVIEMLIPDLENTYWFSQSWLENQINSFPKKFNTAFDRWRTLYKNSKAMVEKADKVLRDPTIKYDSPEAKEARRQRDTGEKQMALLKNEQKRKFGNESEFYVFRYLASEGFLPGYNFTRLPVRAFVGYKHQDQGEYISRPRFIALKEFGPQNLIYHNGSKYKINRMMLLDAEVKKRPIKISLQTGYAFLDDAASRANNDPITKQALNTPETVEIRNSLLELSEVEGIPQERISCEEEERMSTGFVIDQYFRYINGIDSTRQAVIKAGGQELLNVIYGPATELIQLNRRWRRSTDADGFYIDNRNGKWLKQRDLEDQETSENASEVMIFARDTADTLYIQPLKDLGIKAEEVISLSYALKRGIESLFQIEENEVGVWVMGDQEHPNIMIYEAAEGSLGILSQLIEKPQTFKELFKEAYKLLHFNPETKKDDRPDLPKASYNDLLSYYNQPHHGLLDRFSIQTPLETLMNCDIEGVQGGMDRQAKYKFLLESYDKNSATEYKLIKYLYDNGMALPDKAQVNVPQFYISADFVYNQSAGPVLIFCDGSIHDLDEVMEVDSHKRELLRNAGYDVIEWHHSEPVEELVARRKDVFRKIY